MAVIVEALHEASESWEIRIVWPAVWIHCVLHRTLVIGLLKKMIRRNSSLLVLLISKAYLDVVHHWCIAVALLKILDPG